LAQAIKFSPLLPDALQIGAIRKKPLEVGLVPGEHFPFPAAQLWQLDRTT
jgi:hypothetical protein